MLQSLELKFMEMKFVRETWAMGYAKGCDYKPLVIQGTDNQKDTDGKIPAQIQMNQGIIHLKMYPLTGPSDNELKRIEEKALYQIKIMNDSRNSEEKKMEAVTTLA